MPEAPPAMKRCPYCTAPNPARRTECYACKASLDEPPLAPPQAPEIPPTIAQAAPQTYPCAFCAMPIPIEGRFCSTCGKPNPSPTAVSEPPLPPFNANGASTAQASTAQASTTQTPPAEPVAQTRTLSLPKTPIPGWKAELLPDGSARLRRTSGGQLLQDAWLPFFCLLGFVFFLVLFIGSRSHANIGVTVLWGGLSLGSLAALVLVLVWAFAAQEELLIQPKTLTRRRFLGGYEQTWTIDGQAALRIETVITRQDLRRQGTERTRVLLAEHGAQSRVVDRRTAEGTYYGMKVRTLSGMVSDAMGGANWGDEMVLMGRYLSEQTGWPLTDHEPTLPIR